MNISSTVYSTVSSTVHSWFGDWNIFHTAIFVIFAIVLCWVFSALNTVYTGAKCVCNSFCCLCRGVYSLLADDDDD